MKEYPLLLKSEMVRAILEGRKTQTRCPIVPQPEGADYWTIHFDGNFYPNKIDVNPPLLKFPWQVGDRLWVRETWKCSALSHHTPTDGPESAEYSISYKPDGHFPNCKSFKFEKRIENAWQKNRDGWRPSIYMPRWASRITLEITNIRVERIREISEEDAQQEGIDFYQVSPEGNGSYRYPFEMFWDSLYDKKGYGWDKNPWVWVREFRRR